MTTKKAKRTNFSKNHKDGTVWVKGKMLADQPDGYWEWFRKDRVIMRSGFF